MRGRSVSPPRCRLHIPEDQRRATVMAKSRKPKLQLAPESTRPTPPGDDASVHPLTGRLRTTLDAIVSGTALVQNGLIPEDLAAAVLDDPQFASMLGTSIGDVDDDATLDGDLEDDYDEA